VYSFLLQQFLIRYKSTVYLVIFKQIGIIIEIPGNGLDGLHNFEQKKADSYLTTSLRTGVGIPSEIRLTKYRPGIRLLISIETFPDC
jgi:hypothetical protein